MTKFQSRIIKILKVGLIKETSFKVGLKSRVIWRSSFKVGLKVELFGGSKFQSRILLYGQSRILC